VAAPAQVNSSVAWWAKSRMGSGMIPKTTVKATVIPMATRVRVGTNTTPRSVTQSEGGASVSTCRLATPSVTVPADAPFGAGGVGADPTSVASTW